MENKNAGIPFFEGLRGCQKSAIDTAMSYLAEPLSNSSCLISLPTGAGKSGVICTLAHYSESNKVLVLCHRRSICDQLYTQLNGLFFDLVSPHTEAKKKSVFDGIQNTEPNGIYVSSFQKLSTLNTVDLEKINKTFDLLIVDEGHSEPSLVWGKIARKINAHKIIVTATPYRNDLFQFDINPEKSYIYSFKEAALDKIILEPEFTKISAEKIISTIKEALKNQPDVKCIIKCQNFEKIQQYLKILSESFKTLAIHDQYKGNISENTKTRVPKNLEDWQVLIHQKKLDEGVDIPSAKILILTYTVSSGRELVQTIGRVVRLYKDVKPLVVEFTGGSNKKIWENYRIFDDYISEKSHAEKFIQSLDTASLIDKYLEAFPEFSYFHYGFMKKFDLNSFNPKQSITIPLASVCFIKKQADFSLPLLVDSLYWSGQKEGELSKIFEELPESQLLVSICFNNSKFLSDMLFFQPSLEILFVKDLGDFVAIYDSRGRDFSNQKDYFLGASVETDKILNLTNRSDKTRTKEANTRSIGATSFRPDSVSVKGANLESTVNSQENSTYALTTLKVDNLNSLGSKHSSYYLGIASGRVSDQKRRNFNIEELCAWIDDIGETIVKKTDSNSEFINSYAKTLKEKPDEDPYCIQIDFSDEDADMMINMNGNEKIISNTFELFEYKNGISIFGDNPEIELRLDNDNHLIFSKKNNDDDMRITTSKDRNICLVDYLNKLPFKVLYENGTTYLNKSFYRVILPTENGMDIDNLKLGQSLIPLNFLSNKKLTEKDEKNVSIDDFGSQSIFYEIDKLKNKRDSNSPIIDLGYFYDHISDVDLVFCTDMGTEPADFILSSPTKQVFIHVKCGKTSNPKSAAGSISEVGGQALKNLEITMSTDLNLTPTNKKILSSPWPSQKHKKKLADRIRLFQKNQTPPMQICLSTEEKVEEVVQLINQRRRSNLVKKEIWIVVGRSFSKQHFVNELRKGKKAQGESLQSFQLIDGWRRIATSLNVDLKFFVSP